MTITRWTARTVVDRMWYNYVYSTSHVKKSRSLCAPRQSAEVLRSPGVAVRIWNDGNLDALHMQPLFHRSAA